MSSSEKLVHELQTSISTPKAVAGQDDKASKLYPVAHQANQRSSEAKNNKSSAIGMDPKLFSHSNASEERGQDTNLMDRSKTQSSDQNCDKDLDDRMQSLVVSSNPKMKNGDDTEQGTGQNIVTIPFRDEGAGEEIYSDPTPRTPHREISPQGPRGTIAAAIEEGSTSEIQDIMEQFEDGDSAGDDLEDMDTKSATSKSRALVDLPPRQSSLEPSQSKDSEQNHGPIDKNVDVKCLADPRLVKDEVSSHDSVIKDAPSRTPIRQQSGHPFTNDANPSPSPNSSRSMSKLPPPDPDPEPDLPFDFHRFLEQLRHRTADPVAKFLRSFLAEFGKKQWMVHEQVKIISDFLTFITNRMAQCEVWRGVSDAEFDNAKEGMEKLVMNRLYSQTFSPALPAPASTQGTKGKRKATEKTIGPGRKGQHQEDIERDEILAQKVRIYGWIQEEHLDIHPVGDSGRRFLHLAQQELLKIKTYRAPRDKVICVLNCCKVIFGFLRNSKAGDTSADSFVPLLIYVVLHANPDHLVSNVQYILRFRNQDKLGGEAGYYLSSLMGAIQFIENLDRTSLTISDKEFETNVEEAVSVIAERDKEAIQPPFPPRHPSHPQISEKSTLSEPEVNPRNSVDAEYIRPHRPTSPGSNGGVIMSSDGSDDKTAVSGLLRSIQRPLSSLGRMFSEDAPNVPQRTQGQPLNNPNPPVRLSPAVFQPPRDIDEVRRSDEEIRSANGNVRLPEKMTKAEDAAARQANAEAAEAQRIQRDEHRNVVETLAGMFPDLDRDIIDDVVRVKQGRVGLAVDACLALNS